MQLRAIVFDLDGTLIDSKIEYDKIAARVRCLLEEEGVPSGQLEDRRKVYSVIQSGKKALIGFNIKTERIALLLKLIEKAMNEVELEGVHLSKPMPGLYETLTELKHRGISIGIATRGCHEYAIRSLELVGITDYIDMMLARDDVPYPKPDPRHLLEVINHLGATKDTAIYIGDSPTDLKTAEDAGVSFIGYRRSIEWGKRLTEAGCTRMVEALPDVIDIVEVK